MLDTSGALQDPDLLWPAQGRYAPRLPVGRTYPGDRKLKIYNMPLSPPIIQAFAPQWYLSIRNAMAGTDTSR